MGTDQDCLPDPDLWISSGRIEHQLARWPITLWNGSFKQTTSNSADTFVDSPRVHLVKCNPVSFGVRTPPRCRRAARALNHAPSLKRIGQGRNSHSSRGWILGCLAQLMRPPCLSTRTRRMLWSSHEVPLKEEMRNWGNRAEARQGMLWQGSWTVSKNAHEKLSAASRSQRDRPFESNSLNTIWAAVHAWSASSHCIRFS